MAFVQLIDRLSQRIGKAAAWLGLLMVLVAATNAALGVLEPYTKRRLTHVAIDEAEWYLFTVLFLFAAPWGLQAGAHVRVGVRRRACPPPHPPPPPPPARTRAPRPVQLPS